MRKASATSSMASTWDLKWSRLGRRGGSISHRTVNRSSSRKDTRGAGGGAICSFIQSLYRTISRCAVNLRRASRPTPAGSHTLESEKNLNRAVEETVLLLCTCSDSLPLQQRLSWRPPPSSLPRPRTCLLYTSDAADDLLCVD